MRALFASLAAVAVLALLPAAASAVPLVLTDGTNIVRVNSAALDSPSFTPVTGMQADEKLVDLDQRPDTGQLYGLGDKSHLYVINPITGAAIGAGGAGTYALSGTAFGMDFNPVADKLRLVSDNEQNIRLNPDGSLFATDTSLNPGDPDVVSAAYDQNLSGTTQATLFDIDWKAATLLRQGGTDGTPSPNGGTLTTIGPLAVTPTSPNIGFDIGPITGSYATITTAGGTHLYGISLTTGTATDLGQIGTGTVSYPGLAIMFSRLRLAADAFTVSSGGTARIPVLRNDPAPPNTASVHYTTAPGSATSGSDFTPVSGTVGWGVGEAGAKYIEVPVPANSAGEGDETFTVSLDIASGTDAFFGSPTSATVTIAGDTRLQFASADATASEGGAATLHVTRTGLASRAVSVHYATEPTFASTSDFTSKSGTLSWAAGDTAPKTISIPITNDRQTEPAESFGVHLSSPAGAGAKVGTPASADVTIPANDPKPVLKLGGKKRQKLRSVRRKGVAIRVNVDLACRLDASLKRGKRRLGRARPSLAAGKRTVHVKVKRKKDRRKLRKGQRLTISATCSAGGIKSKTRKRTIKLR